MAVDPVSILTEIPSLCALAGNLVSVLCDYIQDIEEPPQSIEELAAELCSFNTTLFRLKNLVNAQYKKYQVFTADWAGDLNTLLENCSEIIGQIDRMVKRAKRQNKSSSDNQIVTCTKWIWHQEEVTLLHKRLEACKSSMALVLQIFSGSGDLRDKAEDGPQRIHFTIQELQQSRQEVRESLGWVVFGNAQSTRGDPPSYSMIDAETGPSQTAPDQNGFEMQDALPRYSPSDDTERKKRTWDRKLIFDAAIATFVFAVIALSAYFDLDSVDPEPDNSQYSKKCPCKNLGNSNPAFRSLNSDVISAVQASSWRAESITFWVDGGWKELPIFDGSVVSPKLDRGTVGFLEISLTDEVRNWLEDPIINERELVGVKDNSVHDKLGRYKINIRNYGSCYSSHTTN
ncbi:hypothetical protein ABW19_dt0201502 [Dactylella cylindrospora]|nr:hypothetical protein ABW19_dt0201502 [Dactylella cylindrospora]